MRKKTPDPVECLDRVYRLLPAAFPPLYEQLVLSYRWFDVQFDGLLYLRANPPGPLLVGLGETILRDPALTETLFPLGFIPFGKKEEGCYDPICFDTRRRGTDGDCPIIQFEHEAILCDSRIGESWPVATSFRELVSIVINLCG